MAPSEHLISEKDFEATWGLTLSTTGDLFSYEEIAQKPVNRVWTIIESGDESDGNWYASPGFHTVNKLGYVLTERPWDLNTADAVYFLDDLDGE